MSKYIQKAKELRENQEIHYNCAQAVVLAYLDDENKQEELMSLFSNYGKGLRCGSLCGAISGAMSVLGYYGVNDLAVLGNFHQRVRKVLGEVVTCKELIPLNPSPELGNRPYCDQLIYKTMEVLEEVLEEQGIFEKNL